MTRARAFRFGLFGENARSPEALLDTARRAEDAGYSTFLVRDHFIEEPFGHQLAPLTALATVAAATKSLRVGSLVLSNDYRHPVTLAKEIATLDVLSSGRVELGLGAGFSKAEYAEQFARERGWAGISADRALEMPSVFIGSIDHVVDAMRARRERYGFSYYVVLDRAMQTVAPIVGRLAGT